MKRLKLQMQLTIDGYCGGPSGELDWMIWEWDEKLKNFVTDLTAEVDCIILGRKMTDGFVSHWEKVAANPSDPEYEFGKKMVDTTKVVFTKTLDASPWRNTSLAKGSLEEETAKLKNMDGGDIILYGGSEMVSNMIEHNLIDDYYLFINPVALGEGKGIPVFRKLRKLTLVQTIGYKCGIVLLQYKKNDS